MAVDGIRFNTPVVTSSVPQRSVNFQGAGEEAAPQPQSSGGGGGSVLLGLVALGAAITAGVLLHKNSKLAKQLAEGAKKVAPEADASAKKLAEGAEKTEKVLSKEGKATVDKIEEQTSKKVSDARFMETIDKQKNLIDASEDAYITGNKSKEHDLYAAFSTDYVSKATSQEAHDASFTKHIENLTKPKNDSYTIYDRLDVHKAFKPKVEGNLVSGRTFDGHNYIIELDKKGKPTTMIKSIMAKGKAQESTITDPKTIKAFLKENNIKLEGKAVNVKA